MRALLVNPWIYDFKAFDFWNKPVGLLIVADILKKLQHDVDFIDCMDRASPYFTTDTKTDMFGRGKYYYEEVEKPIAFKKIPRRYKRYGMPRKLFVKIIHEIDQPDIICVTSSMTYWYPGVFEAISILKTKFPKTKIILGGVYATLCTKHAQKYSGADIIFTGAAEDNLVALLNDVGVISSHIDNRTFTPDYAFYQTLHYGVIHTSRGCPFKCTYCATKFLCSKFEAVPNDVIIEQLDYVSEKTRNIAFFDDALLYNKNFLTLLETITEKQYHFDLHASNGLHCRYIDETIARLMFKANFKTLYLSLETINPEIQKKTGNKVNTEEFVNAVNILIKTGFSPDAIHTYLLFGMPGQSHDEIIEAIKLCHSFGVHPHLCEFSPIPHTEEFEKTGFTENTDPLMHNNLFYTWYWPEPKYVIYNKIKRFLSQGNR
jgi:radical SAM superfamily enzyme YgiQ (UPF0313 family)